MLTKMRMDWAGLRLQARIEKSQMQIKESQSQQLFSIMQRQQSTVFGMQHAFGRIYDATSLRRRVRVQNAQTMSPYIKSIQRGKLNVLTTEPVTGLLKNKNEENLSNVIPVTAAFEKQLADMMTLNVTQASQRFPDITEGLWAHLTRGQCKPTPVKISQSRSYKSIFLSENEIVSDLHYLLQLIQQKNIRLLTARAFDDVVFFSKKIVDLQWHIIAAMNHGGDVDIGRERVRIVQDRDRARALETCVERKGFLTLKDIWPMLRLVALPLDAEHYDHLMYTHLQLADHVPVKNMNCDPFSFYWTNSPGLYTADSVMMPTNAFYEFIPDASATTDSDKTYLMHELDTGARYRILLTTAHGVYRYDTATVIEVAGKQGDAPIVRFIEQECVRRDTQFVSMSNSDEANTVDNTRFVPDFT